jgi:serine/threonine protein kinase
LIIKTPNITKEGRTPRAVKQPKQYALADFEVLQSVGKGSFGDVSLARHRHTNELFALKQIPKDRVRGTKHIEHVINERDIMRTLSIDVTSATQPSTQASWS